MTKLRNLAVVALVLLTAGAYYNSLTGAFVFDDIPAIAENPTIRALWPLSGPLSPPDDSGVGGRPFANFSFAINHAIHGTGVLGYHVGNVLLHLGSALLLFGLVRRTLRGIVGDDERAVTGLAFATAACWSVHPLTTASVAYLSQRTELLMGVCYLGTLYAFVRGVNARCAGWLAASVFACALGMMSKEVMVTAPVVVLLYDRTFLAGTFSAALRQRWIYYAALASTWLIVGYLLTTGLTQRSVGFGLGVSAVEYGFTAARSILLYLKLAVLPYPLVFDYGPIYSPSLAAVVVIASMVGIALWAFARGRRWAFPIVCFFLLLAPTSSFVPVAEQPIAENRMYLPLAALIALVAVALATILKSKTAVSNKGRGADQKLRLRTHGALVVVALFAIVTLTGLTLLRNADYRTALTLWSDTVVKRPQNWRAHFNHGVTLLDMERAAEATQAFERAIALKPTEAKAHQSLGNALLALDRLPEAIARFAEAVRLQPNYAKAWYGLGAALLRKGEGAEAIPRLERALQLEPLSASTEQALGNALFQTNQPARAIPHYARAVEIDPSLADAHYNLGSACLELGRLEDAVKHFTKAANLKPSDAEIRNNLGAALIRTGRLAESVSEFERALTLKPDYADARDNLEVVRRELRRMK